MKQQDSYDYYTNKGHSRKDRKYSSDQKFDIDDFSSTAETAIKFATFGASLAKKFLSNDKKEMARTTPAITNDTEYNSVVWGTTERNYSNRGPYSITKKNYEAIENTPIETCMGKEESYEIYRCWKRDTPFKQLARKLISTNSVFSLNLAGSVAGPVLGAIGGIIHFIP